MTGAVNRTSVIAALRMNVVFVCFIALFRSMFNIHVYSVQIYTDDQFLGETYFTLR